MQHFDRKGHSVIGVDNDIRREFFGPPGDATRNLARLKKATPRFEHRDLDIRDRQGIFALFKEHRFDAILHCAAQPSHHKAKENPRPGEVYNIGGRENSISIREAFNRVDQLVGTRSPWEYRDEARKGDHICYISDLRKLRSHFPNWNFTSTWILERLWSQRKNT